MSKVFVTGGGGFIGSHVTRKLLERGHDVTIYDSFQNYSAPPSAQQFKNLTSRFPEGSDRLKIIRGGTYEKDLLSDSLKEVGPEYIIHMAALPLANLAMKNPEEAQASIINGTINVCTCVRRLPELKRLVYISSSMVYGDFQYVPADETHPTEPKEIYGGLKLCGEIMVKAYAELYDIDYAIVRPSAVYGPMDNNRRVLGIFLENALAGKPLTVNGDSSSLDFTFVSDTADGIVAATFEPGASRESFNITRGKGRTILEAARIIADLVPGTQIEVAVADKKMPSRGTLDVSKAARLIGFQPKIDLEQGLGIYLDYLKN